MSSPLKAVSAPGKVLLAGGYLVLDRDYTGLVFGLDARIHVVIQPLQSSSGVSFQEIIVKSPQFIDAVWEYGYRQTEDGGGVRVTQLSRLSSDPLRRNPFVETALSYTLSYISTHTSTPITASRISILADNDYYSPTSPSSQILPTGSQTTSTPPLSAKPTPSTRFTHFNTPLHHAHKTGLGSSAALTTAFTAALLSHYLPAASFSLSNPTSLAQLHNLSQAAHCAAQGKVGSGFDVASAVRGSCLYRRFSPSLLSSHGEPGTPGFAQKLRDLVDETGGATKWDTQISTRAVQIPRGVRLVMLDVDCGSQTPGMVKQVLAWRSSDPEIANELWGSLHKNNEQLAADLTALAHASSDAPQDYSTIKSTIHQIRTHIRKMSSLSAVPIEPPPQTALLDSLSALPGVIGGVVPGAGGYDAIALLIEDREEVVEQIRQFVAGYQDRENVVGEDGSKVGVVRMLGVRESQGGVQVEEEGLYKGWV